MRENQSTIHRWVQETFPGNDPTSPRKTLRMLDEAVEAAIAAGATYLEIVDLVNSVIGKHIDRSQKDLVSVERLTRRAPVDVQSLADEAADVLIVLYGMAALYGFDLHAEVDRKMEINRDRKWIANGDGTGRHVRQP